MKHYNIPIFIPHLGCPFKCIFCNQKKIASQEQTPVEGVVRIVENHLQTIADQDARIEVAFFGGNFTAIDEDLQRAYLQAVYPFLKRNEIQGIRLSTRPDCIDLKKLDLLAEWGVNTIELGVQSLNDEVLKASCRGYKAEEVFKACHLIKEQGFKLGIQLMIGLPGDEHERDMETAGIVVSLQPDMIRIYPTLVIAATHLETMYLRGEYQPLSLEEAVAVSKDMYVRFRKADIDVIRMGLHPAEDLRSEGTIIAGPFHPSFGELVEQEIFKEQAAEAIKRLFAVYGRQEEIILFVHPRDLSKMSGQKRDNIYCLQEYFSLSKVAIKSLDGPERDWVGAAGVSSALPQELISRERWYELLGI